MNMLHDPIARNNDSLRALSPRAARILIVVDDPWLRRCVADALGATTGFTVIETVTSTAAALDALDRKLQFELAIVDLAMPDKPAPLFIAELTRKQPHAAALVLSERRDDESIFSSLKAGARGYLLKETKPAELIAALKEVLAGGAPMSPAIARKVIASFVPQPVKECVLTPREQDVLRLLAEGKRYEVVASELGVGIGTIQTHVKSLYRKLEVTSKAEAATVALRRGLV